MANLLLLIQFCKMHDSVAMHVLGKDTELSGLYYICSLEQVRLGEISKQLLTLACKHAIMGGDMVLMKFCTYIYTVPPLSINAMGYKLAPQCIQSEPFNLHHLW